MRTFFMVMMKTVYYTLFLSIFLLYGCQEENAGSTDKLSIRFDKGFENSTGLKASDLGKNIRYVPLETTAESVLGAQADIQVCGDKILISSHQRKTLLAFDKNTGKYLNSIGRIGEGPREYGDDGLNNISFWSDRNTDCVYFGTLSRRFIIYKTDGTYQGEVSIPENVNTNMSISCKLAFSEQLMLYMNDNYYTDSLGDFSALCRRQSNQEIRHFQMQFVSPPRAWLVDEGNLLWGAYVTFGGHLSWDRYQDEKTYMKSRYKASCWSYKNMIRYKEDFIDTIFTVTENGNVPYLVFEMGKWKWSYESRFDNKQSRDKITIDYVLENEHKIYFHFNTNLYSIDREKRKTHCGVYDKQSGAVKIMNSDKIANDITNLVPFSVRKSSEEGEFYGILQPSEIIEWFEKNPDAGDKTQRAILERVKEEDNPVVVIIK